MAPLDAIEPAFDAIDACTGALGELDMNCCEPGRSPRMAKLGATLTEARIKLRAATIEPETGAAAAAAIATLEDAGAQVGHLQVTCCAPSRLPLYAVILKNLTKAQLTLNKAIRD